MALPAAKDAPVEKVADPEINALLDAVLQKFQVRTGRLVLVVHEVTLESKVAPLAAQVRFRGQQPIVALGGGDARFEFGFSMHSRLFDTVKIDILGDGRLWPFRAVLGRARLRLAALLPEDGAAEYSGQVSRM